MQQQQQQQQISLTKIKVVLMPVDVSQILISDMFKLSAFKHFIYNPRDLIDRAPPPMVVC